MEVMRHLGHGRIEVDIAHRLGVSRETVRNLKANAYYRLEVSTLIDALHALGWLEVPDE